mgnify:CR=1 FL=1
MYELKYRNPMPPGEVTVERFTKEEDMEARFKFLNAIGFTILSVILPGSQEIDLQQGAV